MNGGSAINYCSKYNYLLQEVFMFSTNCTLYQYNQQATLYQCLSGDSMYVEYGCPTSSHSDRSDRDVAGTKTALLAGVPLVQPFEGLRLLGGLPPHQWLGELKDSSILPLTCFARRRDQQTPVLVEYHVADQKMNITASASCAAETHNWDSGSQYVNVMFWGHQGVKFAADKEIAIPVTISKGTNWNALLVDLKAVTDLKLKMVSSDAAASSTYATLFSASKHEELLTLKL
eukprot:CAMPEP_0176412234 /NCGR_PEP_ID=MMETSP0127-20121128/4036_1 /TAXON_ID=938130 /ORGANISM="Platyophrya macrostoma, Strain WH" /LENGTH=230 /DNA_ID=CAMNT_0017791893 /DNA_START=233 /DNA_END=925 /DNA_ORIENTATION=-